VAEQATGTVQGTGTAGTVAHTAEEAHHHGRPISWVGVAIVTVGFVIGGIAMVPRPTWWAFWLGAGIAVVGLLIMLFAKTFSDDWY
jgi:hypothetical protein